VRIPGDTGTLFSLVDDLDSRVALGFRAGLSRTLGDRHWVSVFVVRAFLRRRRMLADQRKLALKLAELESRLAVHDRSFQQVFAVLRQLMDQPEKKPGQIGFQSGRKS
jgi:hypothetical protein